MVISEHQFDVILYANISEKLISSLNLTYPGPEASLSALKFFLDLGSDGYRQCYTYSAQLAVEVFFFVCVMFSLSGEGQNNAFCIYFILVYYYFIFPYLRAFFSLPTST